MPTTDACCIDVQHMIYSKLPLTHMLQNSRNIAHTSELVKQICSADFPATYSLQLAERHVCMVAHRLRFEACSSKLACKRYLAAWVYIFMSFPELL
jgi:hypothetical protein